MAKDERTTLTNSIDNRETWLRVATASLRSLFDENELPLPESIRYAIAFTSTGRKGKSVGETWHAPASEDQAYEIMIRADIAEPFDVLTVLVRQLVHAALPPGEDHGLRFKKAATRIGLQGKMRDAQPGPLLRDRLNALAASLPPLPHARLNIDWKAVDKPKKQGTRMLQAKCLHQDEGAPEPCGYTIRLSAKWAKVGASCPLHGPIEVEQPAEEPTEVSQDPS